MIWNIPNSLTVMRLVAAPLVAVMFLYFTRPYADIFAVVLFVGAAVTVDVERRGDRGACFGAADTDAIVRVLGRARRHVATGRRIVGAERARGLGRNALLLDRVGRHRKFGRIAAGAERVLRRGRVEPSNGDSGGSQYAQ